MACYITLDLKTQKKKWPDAAFNIAQLFVAGLILVGIRSMLMLVPIMLIASVITGGIVGWLTGWLLSRLSRSGVRFTWWGERCRSTNLYAKSVVRNSTSWFRWDRMVQGCPVPNVMAQLFDAWCQLSESLEMACRKRLLNPPVLPVPPPVVTIVNNFSMEQWTDQLILGGNMLERYCNAPR